MSNLEPEEIKTIHNLFRWEKFNRGTEVFAYNFMLLIGGMLIVLTIIRILMNFSDKSVIYITMPGFLAGLLFLWVYRLGRKTLNEKTKLTAILHKLLNKKEMDL